VVILTVSEQRHKPNMVTLSKNRQIWLLDDGRIGHLKQSQALLSAMQGQSKALQDTSIVNIPIQLRFWQRYLATRIPFVAERQLNKLPQVEPMMVVGTGRRCAFYSRLIKQRFPNTFNVQILDPRSHRKDFSVLIIPEHDHIAADNMISLRGSLVDVAKSTKHTDINWPISDGQKIAILLAGHSIQNQQLLILAKQQMQANKKAQCIISMAPRTDKKLVKLIKQQYQGLSYQTISFSEGQQKYHAVLNTAEQFWVAADSINQLSEVLTQRKAQSVWVVDSGLGKRHQRWIKSLLDRNEVQRLTDYPTGNQPSALAASRVFWQQQTSHIASQVLARW